MYDRSIGLYLGWDFILLSCLLSCFPASLLAGLLIGWLDQWTSALLGRRQFFYDGGSGGGVGDGGGEGGDFRGGQGHDVVPATIHQHCLRCLCADDN